ncbi:MAG: aldo/keto reductase [Pseudomonadales bacterium]|nr:aldo/keto reductase [Pseudomonadales bacterium]
MTASILPRKPLGNTGIEVSCLGLGCVKLGRNEGVKYPSGFTLPDDKEARQILAVARDQGINLIDTAPAYGSSEERLGKLLESRQQWVLSSKVGEEFEQGQSRFDFSARHVRFSVERSLKRLRTDYLDLVLIHSDGNDRDIIENSACIETLVRCREQGLIRAFGMSTKTVAGGLLAVSACDVVMLTYNPDATEDGTVIAAAAEAGKGVLIKKALGSGHLLMADQRNESSSAPEQADPVARSMAFVFAREGVSSIIIGTINPVHIRHNCETALRVLKKP